MDPSKLLLTEQYVSRHLLLQGPLEHIRGREVKRLKKIKDKDFRYHPDLNQTQHT